MSSATRQRILEAVLQTLLDGVSEPAMGEIAARAEISRQALYLHFKSRDEMLLAAVEWANGQIGLPDRLERLDRARTARAKLRHYAQTIAWQVARLGPAMLTLNRLLARDSQLAERWHDRAGSRSAQVSKIVAALGQDRQLRAGLSEADAVAAILALSLPEVVTNLLNAGLTEAGAGRILHRALEGAVTTTATGPRHQTIQ
jgi:AcrR family transcriptional regulator